MKQFALNQRVLVHKDEFGHAVELRGVVQRIRRPDGSAWVDLVERHPTASHAFREGDPRANWLVAYPEDCEDA
jgi:hypothetical protein